MRELEQRQKIRRRLYSLPALLALLLLAGASVKGAYMMVAKERESARDAENLAAEVAALALREAVLEREIEKLKTPAGVEEEIKSKFNVAREGERVAVIVDRTEIAATTSPEKTSWFKHFWTAIIAR